MEYISLFSGVAGLDLGVKLAFPDARCVAYCENNPQAAAVLKARMRDGSIDEAPIWQDAATFPADLFHGRGVGVVGGWPCVTVSVAGKREGNTSERWLWPYVIRVIRESGARWLMGENVAGILSANDGGAWGEVLRDLAEMGWSAEWGMLRASDVGASHGRARTFIVANSPSVRGWLHHRWENRESQAQPGRRGAELADAAGGRLRIDGSASGQPGHVDEFHGSLANSISWASGERRQSESREATSGRSHVGSSGPSRILDDAERTQWWPQDEPEGRGGEGRDSERQAPSGPGESGGILGDSESWGLARRPDIARHRGQEQSAAERAVREYVEDAARLEPPTGRSGRWWGVYGSSDEMELPIFAPGPNSPLWSGILAARPDLAPAMSAVEMFLAESVQQGAVDVSEATKCELRGLASWVASRLVERRHRLSAIGNGVTSLCAATAFRVLARRLGLN